jgi:hypothetical protein
MHSLGQGVPGMDAPPLSVPAFTAYCEPNPEGVRISEERGVTNWTDGGQQIVWFGYVKTPGIMSAAIRLRTTAGGNAALSLAIGKVKRTATWSAMSRRTLDIAFGEYRIPSPGYYRFALQGITRTADSFGSPQALLLSGPASVGAHFNLVERRNAASVHLGYPTEKGAKIVAFYNEVTVRTDPIWSYYMACGFQRGYFGIQVNSPTERRIIFSIWDSGNEGVDRKLVRPEDRVQLLKKGAEVVASDFGNEGTGGHSHMLYTWHKDKTYRFLVTCHPDGTNTDYTAYFYFPERSNWELISSFRAPKDGGYLRGLYSFNENFGGANGELRRLAEFGSQWALTSDGKWQELSTARFTHDPTGRENRKDFGAGVVKDRFYLSNGGFVADSVEYGNLFHRPPVGRPPTDIPAALLP